jgi:hypothetical protein
MKIENWFLINTQKNVFKSNGWLTKGIKISCKYKCDLYLNSQTSNNQAVKIYKKKLQDFNLVHERGQTYTL